MFNKLNTAANKLQFFATEEGYATQDSNTADIKYTYQYKDHLGNVRLSYTDTNGNNAIVASEVIEESNYYPFGLKHGGYNNVVSIQNGNSTAQKWKYNDTEYNESFALNMYEMPFRSYDPALARWTTIDPILHYSMSTYNAFDNNPVFWADPSGGDGVSYNVMDFQGNWHTVGINFIAGGYDFENGVAIQGGDGIDPYGNTEGLENNDDYSNGGDGVYSYWENDCPSCKTQEDWNIYYQQGYNTESMVGKDRLTMGMDEDGHFLFYLDGKLMDIRRYNNRAEAFGSMLGEAALFEMPARLFKFMGKLFNSSVTNIIPEGSAANHLFKGQASRIKLIDNAANRGLIQRIANGKSIGTDPYGKSWFLGKDGAGKLVYAYAKDGIVKGAGYATMNAKQMIAWYNLK